SHSQSAERQPPTHICPRFHADRQPQRDQKRISRMLARKPCTRCPCPSPYNQGMIDMRHLTDFKRRLTDEAGFVLPTAMIVLLMLTVLIGAAVTVASQ